jgi:hypothetical protein
MVISISKSVILLINSPVVFVILAIVLIIYYNSILRTDENVDGRKSHKRERNTTHHNSTNTNDK